MGYKYNKQQWIIVADEIATYTVLKGKIGLVYNYAHTIAAATVTLQTCQLSRFSQETPVFFFFFSFLPDYRQRPEISYFFQDSDKKGKKW